jgi:hypothetical protein
MTGRRPVERSRMMALREGYATFHSARQRVVVLTFDTPAEAEAYDQMDDHDKAEQVLAMLTRVDEAAQ